MSHKSDWVSYTITVMYSMILIGCLLGLRKNMLKKKALLATNGYQKQQRVIRWRFRFYLTLFSAILIRIVSIISAVMLGKTMVLSKATNKQEFVWSCIASIASMLFFSAFTFIIWFFSALTFHRQTKYKRLITPFFTTLNVALYISALSIAISSYAANKWDLLYDYELPLFSLSGWILSLCFIFSSYKISTRIERERQNTVEYIEQSQQHNTIASDMERENETEIRSKHSNIIIARLIKLSLLCALCWIMRGAYLMSLRIWQSTDRTPFNIPALAWEAIFYGVTEIPPSLGALILMISKPKTPKGVNLALSNDTQNQQYPQAKQQNLSKVYFVQ